MGTPALNVVSDPTIHFSIERSALLKSLSKLQAIVERRNAIPILSNVKLLTQGNSLQLTVTDMDIVATQTIDAQVTIEGALTVSAQTLYDVVRKLPDGCSIELQSLENGQVKVKAASSNFNLPSLPAAEFPVMSEGDMSHQFSLNAGELLSMIDKARFAMSSEETRYYLNGVYFHVNTTGEQAILRSVATDGHRLARIESAVPAGAEGMPGVIIPRKTVSELRKLIDEQSDQVNVALSKNKIRISTDHITLLSKLVDGTFPDYARVIPDNNTHIMEVSTKQLVESIDRVATIASAKTKGIKLTLETGKLTLSVQNPESGSAEESIDVTYDAVPIEIGFNSRYLLEMMNQLDGETTQLLFSDSNSPVIARDPADVAALYVVMPMRV